jgi:hypothetical protein
MSANVRMPKANGATGVLPKRMPVVIPANIHHPWVLRFNFDPLVDVNGTVPAVVVPLALGDNTPLGPIGPVVVLGGFNTPSGPMAPVRLMAIFQTLQQDYP